MKAQLVCVCAFFAFTATVWGANPYLPLWECIPDGAPLELPWAAEAATILHEPYLGQEVGRALAKVLFGDVNPSGKLPCTWPRSLEDTPVARKGTYTAERSVYNEGLFVGYRWYEKMAIEPLFPFGHGLSYTSFKYGGLSVERVADGCRVSVAVTNTGARAGAETVQLYVSPVNPPVARPVKELKNFTKVFLAPGETKTVSLTLDRRDFAYWDDAHHDWRAAPGRYLLLVGSSSGDVRCSGSVEL